MPSGQPALLNELPKEKEYEEYVSAYFQAGGYYLERNIIDRDVEEILELDVIAYNYSNQTPFANLIEIKSGGWGFSDVFKIRGWLDYTNLSHAILIGQIVKQNSDYFKRKALELDVDIIINEELDDTAKNLSAYISEDTIEDIDIKWWRYSYWIERQMLKALNKKKKSTPNLKRYKALEDYYFKVNSGLFFTRNIIDRLDQLYDAFKENPRISAKTANEMIGGDFSDNVDDVDNSIFKKTYYECEFNDVQISTYVEHFARLSVLKNLIDYILYKKAGVKDRIEDKKVFGLITKIDFLPNSVREAMKKIENDDYLHLYPVFWQWFLFLFGGFILLDLKEQEYELLSKKSGIPIDQIDRAFEVYEIIFPMSGGWFNKLSTSNIRFIKMFPVPFKAIGANYRKVFYTPKTEGFSDLGQLLTGQYTTSDLVKWNNLGYHLLMKKY